MHRIDRIGCLPPLKLICKQDEFEMERINGRSTRPASAGETSALADALDLLQRPAPANHDRVHGIKSAAVFLTP
jgi:hypothetical protein